MISTQVENFDKWCQTNLSVYMILVQSTLKSLERTLWEKILKGSGTLDLSSLDFVELVNCNLFFTISNKDEGLKTQDKVNFECALTIPLYQEMTQLIEPFEQGETDGYQWLYHLDCPIDLLFSPGGTW